MAENVKVIVRCRPMNRKEQEMKCKNIIRMDDCAVHLENPADQTLPPKTFTFDSVYDWTSTSEAIYNDICYSLVENVLEGYNATIFAYGQTGCGKSHTMQGPDVQPSNKQLALDQRGIISRSFDHIFESISVATDVRYLVLVSYLEIYNENIRDLLEPGTPSGSLVLKEQPGGISVQNLSQHTVHTSQDCEHLLHVGNRNRIVGATLMNATSSRSHSIFTVSVEQIAAAAAATSTSEGTGGGGGVGRQPPSGAADDAPISIKKGKLNLVDLAGSERQAKTGAAGDRLKEATKINLSLSALGNVISALVDGRRSKHIPYRDSRLTRLLQDSLGGNTKTLMVACVSPAGYNYDETLSTLRYASRAKNIHNKPTINEDPKEAMLREYQEEIVKLRKLLSESGGGGGGGGGGVAGDGGADGLGASAAVDEAAFETEKQQLRQRYEEDATRLKRDADAHRREKEELVKDMAKLRSQYDRQVADLAQQMNNNNNDASHVDLQRSQAVAEQARAVQTKVDALRGDLIGGERANDVQLREKHRKKKDAAAKRLSALGLALSRIEHPEQRDALQTHYTDIQHEMQAKTEALRTARQRVRALEREVSDVQAEFQQDRADYLESIRRLQKRLKFYEQLTEKAAPLLQRSGGPGGTGGRLWDPDAIRAESLWNDDVGRWRIPDGVLTGRLRLPPAADAINHSATSDAAVGGANREEPAASSPAPKPTRSSVSAGQSAAAGHGARSVGLVSPTFDAETPAQRLERSDGRDIAGSYFRPRRAEALLQHQRMQLQNSPGTAAAPTKRNAWKAAAAAVVLPHRFMNGTPSSGWFSPAPTPTNAAYQHNHHQQMSLSRTWCGTQSIPGEPMGDDRVASDATPPLLSPSSSKLPESAAVFSPKPKRAPRNPATTNTARPRGASTARASRQTAPTTEA